MKQVLSGKSTNGHHKKAVCIVSGGPDSICAAAYVSRIQKFDVYMINFSYGQRATRELSIAKKFARELKAKDYQFVDISFMKALYRNTNALTNYATKLPSSFHRKMIVPIRNAIFITIATAWALSINAEMVCYGAHLGDHNYPDCRPSFIRSISRSLTLADWDSIRARSRQRVRIWCPAMSGMDKSSLLKLGYRLLGDNIFRTWSCYSNGVRYKKDSWYRQCGICESCINRKNAFVKAGIKDLTQYNK